jgi:hypothetical protein
MPDFQNDPVTSATNDGVAVTGSSTNGFGVSGTSVETGAVTGVSQKWIGVYGETNGAANGPAGIWGDGKDGGSGVKGHARGAGALGVGGFHLAEDGDGGPGVFGHSLRGHGVHGETEGDGSRAGVRGEGGAEGAGVQGLSGNGLGVFAHSTNGTALVARTERGAAAELHGLVKVFGDVEVSGDIRLLTGGDVAELFAVDDTAEVDAAMPGTVMSAAENGRIAPCAAAYDKAVVGIVAGAGTYRPGLVLDAGLGEPARPIAMVGRAFCKVDASFGPIEVGDLLTSSPTVGHAMRASDPARAFGAVVGKSLGRLTDGRGCVPVIVTLQ